MTWHTSLHVFRPQLCFITRALFDSTCIKTGCYVPGTYTPICLLALQGEVGDRLLLLVWTGALLGVGQSFFWVTLPKALTACLYLALGWVAVSFRKVSIPTLLTRITPSQ